MPWYTDRTDLFGIALGDSNMVSSGGFQLGVQTFNQNIKCYATSGAVPYNPDVLRWRVLDPNGASRADEMLDSLLEQETTYIGQVLGGCGSASMQMASTIQEGSGCDTFWLYLGGQGGTTADDWANGGNWDTMLEHLPAAMADIPGSPTYADVIFISLGTNDFFQDYTSDQYYANFKTLRSKMIAEGWWVPGTTQIVMMDIPRNGTIYTPWYGLDYVMQRTNDRIYRVKSVGAEYDPTFPPVHYLPSTLTAMGREAGEVVLAQIPKQQSGISIGGTRLAIGGTKLRLHGS